MQKKLLILLFCCYALILTTSAGGDSQEETDVVVVGGGLAGLSAVISAVEKGVRVVLIDMEERLGGNSAKASSGINGCNTKTQQKFGYKDSYDKFFSDTIKAGDSRNKADLVDVLVHRSTDAVQWLIDSGVPLHDINLCGGHSVPRTHWLPSPKEGKPTPVGLAIIGGLRQRLDKLIADPVNYNIKVLTKSRVIELISEKQGAYKLVAGVVYQGADGQPVTLKSKAVVLSTGGYSNDHQPEDSLLSEFVPDKVGYPTTNGAFATGSGIKMGRKIGAKLLDMDQVQLHPTAFIDPKEPRGATKFLAAEALRGKGAILVNQEGRRFTNELGRRDYNTEKILAHCQKDAQADVITAYMLMNEESAQGFGWPAFNFYWKVKGFFKRYENASEFADEAEMVTQDLQISLDAYNQAADRGKDEFEKTVFPVKFLASQPLFVAKITPALHYTMGGLEIDTAAQVLDQHNQPILGLYAAGEVSAGVHGSNRLAGNSLLECVVFGRIAGEKAVKLARPASFDEL